MAVDREARGHVEESYPLSGLDCPDCALKVEKAIKKMPGVDNVIVNFSASNIHLAYDPSVSSRDAIFSQIESFGYSVGTKEAFRTSAFRIHGLDCPDCAMKLERNIAALKGVTSASLVYETAKLTVGHDENLVSSSTVIKAVKAAGYEATIEGAKIPVKARGQFWTTDKRARAVLISGFAFATGGAAQLISGLNPVAIALYAVTILVAGYRPARSSLASLRSLVFDMNVLMTFAVIGAIILGEWVEGAAVMFLYAIGTLLEAYTMDKTRHAIHGLLEFAPNHALVKTGTEIKLIPVEDLSVGDIIITKPGERIPIDGRVVYGRSSVDQSTITGESAPVTKDPGDDVYAGTLNHEGYIEIETTRLAADSTIARIIHLVEDAQAKRAPSQQFIARFSAYYTPVVIAAAFGVAIIPPLFGGSFVEWFYRALVLLVISCPCALVISTPVSITAAIGAATRNGVLIKGGSHLESIGQIKSVVFDKTGTLTSGRLSVTDIVPLNGFNEADIVRVTAALEAKSSHPLAKAVVDYVKTLDVEVPETDGFVSLPGRGLRADIDGITYYVGNPRLFAEMGLLDAEVEPLTFAMQREGKTVFILGTGEKLLGLVAVADSVRRGAKDTVTRLRNLGIENIIMLTGDNKETADEISRKIGIDEYRADLLPEDKVAEVERLSQKYGRVAMIGDGVNDAPAISRADVGIAMGAAGSDIALETSDIALMGDDLKSIPYTVDLSRRALKIIKQNVGVSIATKIVFIALAVGGMATLWMAVFADTGISILVILNGMRLFSRNVEA
ncbi:MAG: heavy metal translocating P-type ATPase [Actinomycetota bacterium]|nr:heavy metal translocating P-type ATPase [Actinomycetota bacterium]